MRAAVIIAAAPVSLLALVLISVLADPALAEKGGAISAVMYVVENSAVILPPAAAAGLLSILLMRRCSLWAQSLITLPAFIALLKASGDIWGRMTWIEPMGLFYVYYAGSAVTVLYIVAAVIFQAVIGLRRRLDRRLLDRRLLDRRLLDRRLLEERPAHASSPKDADNLHYVN